MKNNLSNACSSLVNLAAKYRKPLTKIALSFALALPFAAAQAAVAPITVSGNKVLFGGVHGSVSGMSMGWSNTGWESARFYTAPVVAWTKNDFKAKLVRAPLGIDTDAGPASGGYLFEPANNVNRVKTVVNAAIANDMYVIIDFHSHKAESYETQSIAFFEDMARTYGGNNNVIYEIYNEPLNVSWTGTIKPYALDVIAKIRAIDPDNLIVVGTPNWSQDVDVASASPITGYANIAYTLHFYAGTHGQDLRTKAQTALDAGIALFVTEWGSVSASGAGGVANSETDAWVTFMKNNKLSNANWQISDKNEGSAAVVGGASASGGWVASQLTASGAKAKSIIQGWPALSGTTTPPPATGWTHCANEQGTCAFSGTKYVRYGAGSSWIQKTVTTAIGCNNTAFGGDPIQGTAKTCQVGASVASGTCGSTNFNKTAVKGVGLAAVAGDCIKYTKDFGTLQIGSWSGLATTYNITSGTQGITNAGTGWTSVTASNAVLYTKVVSASSGFTVIFDHW